jgi:putative spermidine/putrescine transport system ATP-binding protein
MRSPAEDPAVASVSAGYLSLTGVVKSYGATRVVDSLDLSVKRGELISLLGPSGCGKTTLLKLISGLVSAERGQIDVDGRNVTRLPAHKRNISVVFQNYALFPHLNVADNVAFGLRARQTEKSVIADRVRDALRLARMEEFSGRAVSMLSGGQQQRVAVARALVVNPDLLLLDEPFSALDRKLRETMQVELKTLLRDRGMTAVFVTHDQEEALAVSSRIAVMNGGRIEQYADPTTLYTAPATDFVLDFVGLSTRLRGRIAGRDGANLAVDTAHGRLTALGDFKVGDKVIIGVRPERIKVGPPADNTPGLSAPLADVMPLGSKTHLHGATSDGERLLAEVPAGELSHTIGDTLTFSWPPEATLLFPADGA